MSDRDLTKKNIFQTELQSRRRRILRSVGSDAIVCMFTAEQKNYSNDVHYPYRQDSNFYYLNGSVEDQMIMVLAPEHPLGDYILFCTPNDERTIVWEGARMGLSRAKRMLGADKVFPIEKFTEIFPSLIDNRQYLYCDTFDIDKFSQLTALCRQTRQNRRNHAIPSYYADISVLLGELRVKKSKLEIETMQQAVDITAIAHRRMMQVCRPGLYEYEIDAEFMKIFNQHHARPAYPSIVAAGANACVLHYTDNKSRLKSGDLLLVDAGCEYQMYASDITRTIPINKRFNSHQRELYEVVLEAQLKAIAKVQTGNNWSDVNNATVRVLTRGLIDLGLLKGSLTTLLKRAAYKDFYMHGIGHWLGLDVHDTISYNERKSGEPRRFQAGMVLTIEPGLYINNRKNVAKQFRNTGIRIEDDVLVTTRGPEVLSKDLVKNVDDIESLMSETE